jgi:phage repressor protein C with HTH and peptisase S24 domain
MDLEETRRKNLQNYIDKYWDNLNRFCTKFDITRSNIYAVLKGERAFGEQLARKIEEKIGLPRNSIDNPAGVHAQQDSNIALVPIYEPNLSTGDVNCIFSGEIVGEIGLPHIALKKKGLKAENLICFEVEGSGMLGTINEGDYAIIDTKQKEIFDGSIYALYIGNKIRIKRLFKNFDEIIVRSDNPIFPEKKLLSEEESHLQIIGKVVFIIGSK